MARIFRHVFVYIVMEGFMLLVYSKNSCYSIPGHHLLFYFTCVLVPNERGFTSLQRI